MGWGVGRGVVGGPYASELGPCASELGPCASELGPCASELVGDFDDFGMI